MCACTCALVLATASPRRGAAQSADSSVRVGARIRVWERITGDPAVITTGHVTGLGPATLSLIPDGNEHAVTMERTNLQRINVSAGPKSGSRVSAAATGAVIGSLTAATAGVIAGDATKHNAAKGGAVGFGLGAVVGGVIGALRPREGWQTLKLR